MMTLTIHTSLYADEDKTALQSVLNAMHGIVLKRLVIHDGEFCRMIEMSDIAGADTPMRLTRASDNEILVVDDTYTTFMSPESLDGLRDRSLFILKRGLRLLTEQLERIVKDRHREFYAFVMTAFSGAGIIDNESIEVKPFLRKVTDGIMNSDIRMPWVVYDTIDASKMKPLTTEAFRRTLRRMDHPDYAGRVVDPLKTEMRRTLSKEMIESLYELNLAFPEVCALDTIRLRSDMTLRLFSRIADEWWDAVETVVRQFFDDNPIAERIIPIKESIKYFKSQKFERLKQAVRAYNQRHEALGMPDLAIMLNLPEEEFKGYMQ